MKLLRTNGKSGTHAPSWYLASTDVTQYPRLEEDTHSDVCIVGAGFTGLSSALFLQQAGFSVTMLDAHRVAWGASGRNGGQLGTGFNQNQQELEQYYGVEQAHALWRISESAKHSIHALCAEHDIDAQYQSGIIIAKHRKRYVADAHRYCDKLARDYDYPHMQALSATELRHLLDSPGYYGGVVDHGAGHIHPLAFATGLAKAATKLGATIHELSTVESIEQQANDESLIKTAAGSIRARHVILACNGYLDNLEPAVQRHVMPINNFMIATEPLGDRAAQLLPGKQAVYDSRFVVNYYRLSQDNRLLFGGGETYGYRFPTDIKSLVRKPMLNVFPQLHDARIDYAWGGTLAITRSRLPFVKRIEPNVYSASGYSGSGVALAVEAGRVMSEAIGGDSTRFNTLTALKNPAFPGGRRMRSLLLKGAMSWYALRDKY